MEARKALPYLKKQMPYDELRELETGFKLALHQFERLRMAALEAEHECIDGVTGGHHRDVLDLIQCAIDNIPASHLNLSCVYMNEHNYIQFGNVIESLHYFRLAYLDTSMEYRDYHEDKEYMSDALERICSTSSDNFDDQVNREILRYWNDRVRKSLGKEHVRRARKAVIDNLSM